MRTARAVVRYLLFVISTLVIYSAWFVTHFLVPNKIYWRQLLFYYWTKSFILISHMKIEVIGTAPKPPFFLVTNHLGYTDIAAIRTVATGIFVARADINSWFLAGRIVRDLGTIFIDRNNRRDIPRAGERITERLNRGEGVTVFPEGKSTKGDEVLPFNSSFLEFAARTETPVSYATITYRTAPGEPPPSQSVCWWEDIGFFAHLWRLLKVREYCAILHFGSAPIISPDRKCLAADLHLRITENFTPIP